MNSNFRGKTHGDSPNLSKQKRDEVKSKHSGRHFIGVHMGTLGCM